MEEGPTLLGSMDPSKNGAARRRFLCALGLRGQHCAQFGFVDIRADDAASEHF